MVGGVLKLIRSSEVAVAAAVSRAEILKARREPRTRRLLAGQEDDMCPIPPQ